VSPGEVRAPPAPWRNRPRAVMCYRHAIYDGI